MIKKNALVMIKQGLHARPLVDLIKLCNQFKSNITIKHNNNIIKTKDMLGLLSAGINFGDNIEIAADGIDEEIAINKILDYVNKR